MIGRWKLRTRLLSRPKRAVRKLKEAETRAELLADQVSDLQMSMEQQRNSADLRYLLLNTKCFCRQILWPACLYKICLVEEEGSDLLTQTGRL